MELAMSLDYLGKMRGTDEKRGFEAMASMCREAGFRYVDYTPDFRSDDWEKRAQADREILDRAELMVEQTHAPFNRYGQHPEELFAAYYRRVFEASKILGAKYVVVHADEYRTVDHYDEKEAEDFAYDFLAPYVDYAKKNGMTVAIENVFEDSIRRCPQFGGKSRYTSRIHELKAIIERFNDPAVQCCWDFGHANCAFGKDNMLDALKEVGKYLCCTHVHDNYYEKDLHLAPFLGEIRWEEHMAYLKEIGYAGKFSFEMVYGRQPEALLGGWLKELHKTGEYLVGLYDAAEK